MKSINTSPNLRIIIIVSIFISALYNCRIYGAVNLNARFEYYKSRIEQDDLKFVDKSVAYDSVISIASVKGDFKTMISYMVGKSKLFSNEGEYLKALGTYDKIITVITTGGNRPEFENIKKDCMLGKAKMARNLGMYDQSIATLFDLLKYNKNENTNYSTHAYSTLGALMMNIKKNVSAEKYHRMALHMVKSNDTISDYVKFTVYVNYAGILYMKQQYDSSLNYMSKAKEYLLKEKNIHIEQVSFAYNLSIIYQAIGEYMIAEEYLLDAIRMSNDNNGYSYIKLVVIQNLAELYLTTGKTEKAISYYKTALENSNESGINMIRGKILIGLGESLYKKGDYKQAFDLVRQGQILKDSIFNIQNMERIELLKNDFENNKIRMEKELLQKNLQISQLSNEKKNIQLYILLTLIVIFSVITFIFVNKLRNQNRTNYRLTKKISYLYEHEQTEISNSKQKFEDTIEMKNKELTSNALFLVKTSEMLEEVKKHIKKLTDSSDEKEKILLTEELHKLVNNYNLNKGWDEFKFYFEQVNQSFFINLNNAYPGLSSAEQRLCALVALNMNAKEIATITSRSVRTIETFIYRLRKKLDIPAETKTVVFLRSFME